MTEEDDADIRRILKRNGIFEAHRLIGEYKGYRNLKGGGTQEVLVRVYDMGPENHNARYSWEVSVPSAEESEAVPANPADSILAAGHNPHWNLLDTTVRQGEI